MKNEIWRPLAEMRKEKLWYAIVTRDRYGKVVARERRKSFSFLKQWNQASYLAVRFAAVTNVKDVGGTLRTCAPHNDNFLITVAAGNINLGIIVGTGDTAVTLEDFQLEARIPQGLAADQMEYAACTVPDSVVAAPSCYFVASRVVTNNSGGIITVKEAGIYIRVGDSAYACGLRDILTVPQAVPDGGSITIDWSIGVTA